MISPLDSSTDSEVKLTLAQRKALAVQITSDKTLSFREKERMCKTLNTEMQYTDYELTVKVNAPVGAPRNRSEAYYRRQCEQYLKSLLFGDSVAPTSVTIKIDPLRQTGKPTAKPKKKVVKRVTKKKTSVRKDTHKRLQTPRSAAHMNWS